MKKPYKGYYDFLKEELSKFKGGFEDFILYVPELFRLLCKLLNEDIKKSDRQKINSALAYFIVPTDIIPEEIYGPMGYVDDIFVCAYVLRDIQKKYGASLFRDLWDGEEDFEEVLKVCYDKSSGMLKEKGVIKDILKYSGLS
jgi:uncharacterized membrane protein YkvA (DUF1232 family)